MLKTERTRLAMLKILADSPTPLGATRLRNSLLASGVEVQTRTVRFHLLQLDKEGLTQSVSRRAGRIITRKGQEEVSRANVIEKIGVVSAKVDNLAYQMTFRPESAAGTVVVNVSMIYPEHVNRALNEMKLVFRNNLSIGSRIILAQPGELLARAVVPRNYAAIATPCSITISGILLHQGIPVKSRFGGLLEVRNRTPVRFVELIEYQGSTLDPLEVFIQAKMTRVRDVILTGSGILCAGFREIPSVAVDDVRRVERRMRAIGLGGIVELGKPNQPLLGIPVSDGHAGMIVYGGLNPVALLHESGIPVKIRSLAGLEDFASFRTVEEFQRRLR